MIGYCSIMPRAYNGQVSLTLRLLSLLNLLYTCVRKIFTRELLERASRDRQSIIVSWPRWPPWWNCLQKTDRFSKKVSKWIWKFSQFLGGTDVPEWSEGSYGSLVAFYLSVLALLQALWVYCTKRTFSRKMKLQWCHPYIMIYQNQGKIQTDFVFWANTNIRIVIGVVSSARSGVRPNT